MKLLRLETPEQIELVSSWLTQKENYQWLDFGNGQQQVSPALLRIMSQRDNHFLRVYTSDDGEPVGIVGLDGINRKFRTATLWGATGDKAFRSRGYAFFAASRLLTMAFNDLGLHAVNTWVVDGNPSRRLVEKLNFRYCGRQREAHYIDGRPHDRLFFDLLASEHVDRAESRHRLRRTSARSRPVMRSALRDADV